jgi:hypothetical protein
MSNVCAQGFFGKKASVLNNFSAIDVPENVDLKYIGLLFANSVRI